MRAFTSSHNPVLFFRRSSGWRNGIVDHDDLLTTRSVVERAIRLPRQIATLIATLPHSRGAMRPRFAGTLSLQEKRAQGKPGVRCTRSRAWSVVSTRVSHHRFTGFIRLSPRNGFNGLFRALPGDRALLPPSPAPSSAPT